MKRVLLVGNFGVGNFGDEALRTYFTDTFRSVDWVVVSACPAAGELPRLPAGLRSFLSFRWIRTFRVYRTCSGVVFGGGSLFTDTESSEACLLWWIHAFAAWFFSKPYHLAFQGFGPFRTAFGRWCARWALCHAASVSVRDEASLLRAESLVKNKKIVQTFDPIFCLFKANDYEICSKKILVAIPRRNSSATFAERYEVHRRSGLWDAIGVLSLQPDDPMEQETCARLMVGDPVRADTVPIRTAEALIRAVSQGSSVLSERFHGALAALALGVSLEIVPQRAGDKLDALRGLIASGRADPEHLRELVRAG